METKKPKLAALAAVLAVGVASFMFACSGEPDESGSLEEKYSTTRTDDGALSSVTKKEAGEAMSLPEGAPGDVEKAGCTHIQFCNARGPEEVICITNDRPCGSAERFNECVSDANFVCGNWRHMTFKPPIPL